MQTQYHITAAKYGMDKLQQLFNKILKDINDNQFQQDVEVFLEEGDYYISTPICLNHSRTNGKLIIKSDQNKPAVVHGGLPITNWESVGEGIYRTSSNGYKNGNTLYSANGRVEEARYPKKIDGAVPRGEYLLGGFNVYEDRCRKMGYNENDFPDISDPSTLKLYVWPAVDDGRNWHQDTACITNLDTENRIFHWELPTDYGTGKGSRYYLKGAKEFLTAPNEYYFDEKTESILLIPRCIEDLNHIIIPMTSTVFCIEGTDKELCRNIEISGLKIAHTTLPKEYNYLTAEQGMLFLHQAQSIQIHDCEICYSGWHAVHLFGEVVDCRVENCWIHNAGHTGIQMEHLPRGGLQPYLQRGNWIISNHICDCGEIIGHASCMELIDSGDNTIAYNRMERAPRYGLGMSSMYHRNIMGKTAWDGRVVTMENAPDYQHTRGNRIMCNDMSNVNQDSQDTGVLETWCPGLGNHFHHNLLHDSNIYFSFGNGLYLDDNANELTVSDNVIYNLQREGEGCLNTVLVIKGVEDKIYNNIIADNGVPNSGGGIGCADLGLKRENHHQQLRHNIISNSGERMHFFANWDDDRYTQCNENLYHAKNPAVKGVHGFPDALTIEEWKHSTQYPFDQNSICGDPLFMDRNCNDYRLRYDSPAHLLGIRSVDGLKPGLATSYKFQEPSDVEKVFIWHGTHPEISYVNLGQGESVRLQTAIRNTNGCFVEGTLNFRSEQPDIAEISSAGIVTGVSTGVARIYASCGSAVGIFDILVEETAEKIVLNYDEAVVAVGQKASCKAMVQGKLGSWMNDIPIHIVSDNSAVIRVENDEWIAVGCGVATVCYTAEVAGVRLSTQVKVTVLEQKLTNIKIELSSPVSWINENLTVKVFGTFNNGVESELPVKYWKVVEPQAVVQQENHLKFLEPGNYDFIIEANVDGVVRRDSTSIVVLQEANIPDGYHCEQYGDALGCVVSNGGEWTIVSNGDNIWYEQDDVTFLCKEVKDDDWSEVSCSITSLQATAPNSQVGILIKQENTAQAGCLNFRVDDTGLCMVAHRAEFGENAKGMYSHMKDRSLPSLLKIKRVGEEFEFWYKEDSVEIGKSKPWILVGKLDFSLKGTSLIGVALLSNNRNKPSVATLKDFTIR